jgi:hypothetical protein
VKQALIDLFSSKKFLMLLAALIVASGAKLGLELDNEIVLALLGIFAVAIGAQGAADAGKEAARTYSSAADATAKAAEDRPVAP